MNTPHRTSSIKKISNYSLILIGFSLLLMLASFWSGPRKGMTIFGSPFGGDFVAFHSAGRIVNEYGVGRLYDLQLHDQLNHESLPGVPLDWRLPYVNPPFVALLFTPFGMLPLWLAYLIWIIFSIGLYLAAIRLMLELNPSLPRSTTILAALAFGPLCALLAGGQLSALGCFIFAAWIYCLKTERRFMAGLVLGFLLYKPTLALIVIPALVFGRQFRMLTGFIVVAALLVTMSVWMLGVDGSVHYIAILREFSHSIGWGDARAAKYVDFGSFIRNLAHIDLGVWSLLPALPIAYLVRRDPDKSIFPTFLFNSYAPIYDLVMLVPALLNSPEILSRRLLLVLFITSFVSVPLCQITGIQILTPVLICFSVILLRRQQQRLVPLEYAPSSGSAVIPHIRSLISG